MIIEGTSLSVADNSGAKLVYCIRILSSKKEAEVGDVIVIAIRKALPKSKVSSGMVHLALVVRTKKGKVRGDGTVVSFSDNAVVLINKQREFVASRVFGPVDSRLRYKKFARVLSLALEVV